jgi:hypothetical protein
MALCFILLADDCLKGGNMDTSIRPQEMYIPNPLPCPCCFSRIGNRVQKVESIGWESEKPDSQGLYYNKVKCKNVHCGLQVVGVAPSEELAELSAVRRWNRHYVDLEIRGTKAYAIITGLQIFLQYGCGDVHAEHDVIYAGGEVSSGDAKTLTELGWLEDEEDEGWMIFT